MTDVDNIQTAIEAGATIAVPKQLDPSLPFYSVTIPFNGHHQLIELDVDKYAAVPRRARGTYRPATVVSLIDFIDRHLDEEATTIWVHPTTGRIVALFNDASLATPGFRDHGAVLELTQTQEWKHWISHNGQLMTQQQFAEHIEDGLPEIVTPPAADMLELAQTMQAKLGANFRSAIRLQDGTIQSQYDEEIAATAGTSGQLTIPPAFTLSIAPFIGELPYAVNARLRYRVKEGKLSLGYKLDRPEAVVEDALTTIAGTLAAKYVGLVFIGSPA